MKVYQEKDANVNNTNNINTVNAAGIKDNAVDENIVYGCADDPNMPNLEENIYSNNDEDVGAEADMTNLDTNIPVFAPVARIEAIRMFLAYASFKDFIVYQMDVKSAFMYDKIEEEVYVCQPLGFEDPKFPDRVYKVEKALYGLHQALRAWYETLSTYLLDNGFHRGQIDKTLFIKRVKCDILLVQLYVDDIIFGSIRKEMCIEFEEMMRKKFQMSFMGEITFFLGLQVTQKDDGIFISQDENAKDVDVHLYRSMIGSLMYLTSSGHDIMFVVCACARFQVTPKVSHLHAMKRIFRYLKGQPKLDLWYPKDLPFNLEAYTDSEYAAAKDRIEVNTGNSSVNAAGHYLVLPDETIHEERRDRVEGSATTAASLDAKQDSVLALENNKTAQDLEITHLKKRVKRLEKKKKLRTPQLKRRLLKVRIKSFAEKSLGNQEDASKKGKNDQDEGISFVQEDVDTHGRYDHNIEVNTTSTSITTASINLTAATVSAPITTAGVSVSTAETSTPPTTTPTIVEDEDLKIAQTLMKMRNKAKGKMVEPEKPLKKKDQIMIDEEVARNIEAQLQGELEEEERLARQKEEEANIALITEWDDVQAMMDADHELAERLQAKEQGELLKDIAEGSETKAEGSSKRAGEELKSNKSIKQKVDKKVEAEVDNDQDEAEMKMYMKIVPDDEMLQNIDKENLKTLWKLVKAKYGNTRPEEAYERVLWGDLKVMFEPDTEKKRYPLTPATITDMLNRRLQADQ
nr:retrovirus-related Pol polyprotein from transposon TNT 1-94 [Tanacetum cinerariifolium]